VQCQHPFALSPVEVLNHTPFALSPVEVPRRVRPSFDKLRMIGKTNSA
jgi:hypothetical protein